MSNANLTGFSHAILDSQNRVLTATRSTYGILRFDFSTGIAQSVASGPFLQRATSIAFDQVGNLIVGGSDEWLTRINLTTGAQEHLTHFSFSSGIQDVDVGADGLMYVLDFGNYPSGEGRVFTYDSATGIQHLLAQGGDIYQAGDMMIAPDGNLLVLSSTNHASKIVKVDAKTGQQQLLKTLGDEGFISLDRDGSLLFAGFYGMDVERINLTSGVISHVGNIGGIGNLTGIAVVVPEPTATVLAILGAIAFFAGRRSRRN
jgi:hypothetical protein